jgi:3-hydroxyethyl bacteriochlorophyllide a dehydrogenase
MDTLAVVLQEPGRIDLATLDLTAPGEGDVVVDVAWSGISTGTERLLWSGRMPSFPGMGYPLVPGYETVGRIAQAAPATGRRVGELVYVPGARCFGEVRSLFGGAAARLVTSAARTYPIDDQIGQAGVLLALAATAYNALPAADQPQPDLIVGHGVVGRLLARLACARGGAPTVWETQASRRDGAAGYQVIDPAQDGRRDYRCIVDASGAADLLDTLITRLAPGGEVVLAGFYDRLSFAFPPAFMREARLRVAAEWREPALLAVRALIDAGRLSLDGLITHVRPARDAATAYGTAFEGGDCLKMVLDWSTRA